MEVWQPEIASSAHKHGLADDDLPHAFTHAIASEDLEDGFVMLVGSDRTGRLIEVGVVTADDGTPVLVHGMPARARFLRGK